MITFNLSGMRNLAGERSTAKDSGISSLASIARWHGKKINLRELKSRLGGNSASTISELSLLAESLGLTARLLNILPEQLSFVRKPAIVAWEKNRFVILERITSRSIVIYDPLHGRRRIPLHRFTGEQAQNVLELWPTSDFVRENALSRVKLSQILSWTDDIKSVALGSLGTSVFIQVTLLILPLFSQIVIDQVIPSGDFSLLATLAGIFIVLGTLNALSSVFRSIQLQYVGNSIAHQVSLKLHNRIFRLPSSFFSQYGAGEVFQRFRGIEVARSFINGGVINGIFDALLVFTMGIFMAVYSAKLALLVAFICSIYIVLKIASRSFLQNAFAETLETDNREAVQFLETLRGVPTLKTNLKQLERTAAWHDLYVQKLNSSFRYGNLTLIFQAIAQWLGTLSDVFVLFLGTELVLQGAATIGMIMAFLAYKAQVFNKVISITDQWSQYKVLGAQLDRIGDIALSPTDPIESNTACPENEHSGNLEFRNLSFRYLNNAKFVLQDIKFIIPHGQFVAVMGPSGCGKSTFLRLLLGLYPATSGEILLDGVNIEKTGIAALRSIAAAVMQDDIIFSGTISDNISLFDGDVALSKVKYCAEFAELHGTIMQMPLQYETMIGERGFALSQGQRQRILIARAIYRNPKIIVMDEGTANLDAECERKILDRLSKLDATKILVTHSMEISKRADRVINLSGIS